MSIARRDGVRVGIDAANLARDRRGIGRIVRGVLRAGAEDPRFDVVLLASKRADRALLRAEFPALDIRATAPPRGPEGLDVVWFPFNGMRYHVTAPSVVSINDAFAFTEPHPQRIARYREQAPIRRAAREAAQVVTISRWSRTEIVRELGYPMERIAIVEPGPDPFFTPGDGDALPPGIAGKRFALVVGAGEARKNVRLALAACARALRDADELLVVVGHLADADRAFARALGGRAGEIVASDGLLRALYRKAKVVLVPSHAEGYGLVAVEAMACGAPLIASRAGALPEAVDDGALLLDPHDVPLWSHAIRRVFDDGAVASDLRARAAARAAVLAQRAPAREMLAVLEQLAHGFGTA
jgi:glycosyltransferase involved in cell wall biosynthesis